MARNPKSNANLKPIQKGELSSEEAKKRGQAGAKKSAEVRRAKRTAKETIELLMSLPAVGNTESNLETLGIPKEERTYMMASVTKAMAEWLRTGDPKYFDILMRHGGFDEAERRKTMESMARIRAMDQSGIPIQGETENINRSEVFVVLPDDGRGAPGATAISEEDAQNLMNGSGN